MRTPLVDSFGREHRDLRISVTDRCNLRCTYCMPADGLDWLERSEILTFEEIERIAQLMVTRWGVDSIRLTGGEPTIRAGIDTLVAKLAALRGPDGPIDLAMTTNGVRLDTMAAPLRAAGLTRLNISLDTLRADRFVELTRRDDLEKVLAGIEAAVAVGFERVKINCVVMAGINDDEIVDMAEFGREVGAEVRFIEFMPLDADGAWTDKSVVTSTEIVSAITDRFPAHLEERHHDPAARYSYVDGAGAFGVIPSVTEPFCESCDRVRLSAEGGLRNCLFGLEQFSLRDPLRAGATDVELAAIIETCVAKKWAGHHIGKVEFIRPSKSMSQIGG